MNVWVMHLNRVKAALIQTTSIVQPFQSNWAMLIKLEIFNLKSLKSTAASYMSVSVDCIAEAEAARVINSIHS